MSFDLNNAKIKLYNFVSRFFLKIFLYTTFIFAILIEFFIFMFAIDKIKRIKSKIFDGIYSQKKIDSDDTEKLMSNIEIGDVLMTKDSPISIKSLYIGHIGLIYDSWCTIETSPTTNGVYQNILDSWLGKNSVINQYDKETVYLLRYSPKNNQDNEYNKNNRKKLTEWTYNQLGKSYNFNFFNRFDKGRYYCSQLIWRTCLDNLNSDLCLGALNYVSPNDILKSKKLKIYYSRQNKY